MSRSTKPQVQRSTVVPTHQNTNLAAKLCAVSQVTQELKEMSEQRVAAA